MSLASLSRYAAKQGKTRERERESACSSFGFIWQQPASYLLEMVRADTCPSRLRALCFRTRWQQQVSTKRNNQTQRQRAPLTDQVFPIPPTNDCLPHKIAIQLACWRQAYFIKLIPSLCGPPASRSLGRQASASDCIGLAGVAL